jgi:acyl carrier protein
MQKPNVLQELKEHISRVLEGKDIGLNESTPLLAWHVINSLEIVRLLNFIQNRFQVKIPLDLVVAENFNDLKSITRLILRLAEHQNGGRVVG